MSEHALHDHRTPLVTLRNWSFAVGALLVLLGIGAFARPLIPSITVTFFIGGLLVAAGVMRIMAAFGTYTWKGFWLTLLCGSLSLVSGTAMLAIPGIGIEAMVVFLGVLLLFEAGGKLAAAFSVPRDYPWGWLLLDGVVTAVLGAILVAAGPAQAAVYLGLIIGIHLVASGAMLLGAGVWLNRTIARRAA
jgi:uncharacterized membrane protein HdeD (DUF308 family)